MFDSQDNPSIIPSDLDKIKIESMEIGDVTHAECGVWSLFRYKKEYTLVFAKQIRGFPGMKDFVSIGEVYRFLNQISNEN